VESEVIIRIEAGTDGETGAECKLELKICERCGGLWLRPAGSRWIYCGRCKAKVDDLPAVCLKPTKRYSRNTKDGRRPAKLRAERVQ